MIEINYLLWVDSFIDNLTVYELWKNWAKSPFLSIIEDYIKKILIAIVEAILIGALLQSSSTALLFLFTLSLRFSFSGKKICVSFYFAKKVC